MDMCAPMVATTLPLELFFDGKEHGDCLRLFTMFKMKFERGDCI